jgi:hypothetical protein
MKLKIHRHSSRQAKRKISPPPDANFLNFQKSSVNNLGRGILVEGV